MEGQPKVLITGITGYLGSHVTLQALRSRKYRIRGSVRNKHDPKKIEFVKEIFKEECEHIELVSVDLMDANSLKEAVKGSINANINSKIVIM